MRFRSYPPEPPPNHQIQITSALTSGLPKLLLPKTWASNLPVSKKDYFRDLEEARFHVFWSDLEETVDGERKIKAKINPATPGAACLHGSSIARCFTSLPAADGKPNGPERYRAVWKYCAPIPVSVIVLDWFRAELDWRPAMVQLSLLPGPPRILLAARAIDDGLWRDVPTYRGYHVVRREGDPEQLIRTVRFAC